MARNVKYYNSDNSPVLACTHERYSHAFKSEWFQHPPCTEEQAEWIIQCYRRRGYAGDKNRQLTRYSDTRWHEDSVRNRWFSVMAGPSVRVNEWFSAYAMVLVEELSSKHVRTCG